LPFPFPFPFHAQLRGAYCIDTPRKENPQPGGPPYYYTLESIFSFCLPVPVQTLISIRIKRASVVCVCPVQFQSKAQPCCCKVPKQIVRHTGGYLFRAKMLQPKKKPKPKFQSWFLVESVIIEL